MSLPHNAVGWSAVYDYGISWSYSLNYGIYLCKIAISLTSGSEDVVLRLFSLAPLVILFSEVEQFMHFCIEGIKGNIYFKLFHI